MPARPIMTRRRRRTSLLAVAALSIAGLAPAAAALPDVADSTPHDTASLHAPVSPAEALRITEQLAARAPELPPGLAALVLRPGPDAPSVGAAQASAAAAEGEHPTGTGCQAQFHHGAQDRNADGELQPWEESPHDNETCEEIYVWDEGVLELRTESVTEALSEQFGGLYEDEVGRTYDRVAGRELAGDGGHAHGACDPTQEQWDTAVDLALRTKSLLRAKYTNNPLQLLADGYWPYPVPATKTFHWVNNAYYTDHHEDGSQIILDETRPEMIMMTMTDDGFLPFNTAWVYLYEGEEDPHSIDVNDPAHHPNGDNGGTGCLISWHSHTEGVEDEATFNTDGRTWMAHMWFYGGIYPFGDSDIDGSEPHGWWTPLNSVPVLCNNAGGCI